MAKRKRGRHKKKKKKVVVPDTSETKLYSDLDVTLSHCRADSKNATTDTTNQDNQSDSSGSQDGNPCPDSTDPAPQNTTNLTADFDANTKTLIEYVQEIKSKVD